MDFQTKDSGKRMEFATGMVRDTNEGKARFDLIFPKGVPYSQQLLTRFAELMARGADKYTERNWERASTPAELERAMESALRHMMQWYNGETDEDHAAAVMFNLMAAEYIKLRMVPKLFSIEGTAEEHARARDMAASLCETAGQHVCSKHPSGFPTATGALRGQ